MQLYFYLLYIGLFISLSFESTFSMTSVGVETQDSSEIIPGLGKS